MADDNGKVPITSSSNEALAQFLEGRTLVENLRLTDAIPHFKKAVEKDGDFAMAHLYLAQTAPTAKEFFAYLDKASDMAGKATEGERLWILGFRDGAYANPVSQRAKYTKLVEAFPNDERARTLLGISYFGTQEYEESAKHLEKAISIAPKFAPAYNQLGYAYRFLNRFKESEETFKKYTQLIPDDPNPYDSYAELLLKMGRFDESITQYRKALAIDKNFVASFTGVAGALMYQGKHDAARAELKKSYDIARNDGERRGALFTTTVTYLDQGKTDLALKELDKQYALGEKINDAAAMSGDLVFMGNIYIELGKADEAMARFDKALAVVKSSNLAAEVKENTALAHHFNVARVALLKNDMQKAWAEAEAYRKGAEAKKNLNQIRLSHELAGQIALRQEKYDEAIAELQQSNQQNPYNLYRLALAYQEKGNKEEARKAFQAAARFNGLPAPNYAYVRMKAEKVLATI
jgi:tetratricopeptide (TPR) repeat protein